MPTIKSDIRIIDGDVTSAVEVIKAYLSNVGYIVDYDKSTQNTADIEATNLQQSVAKLYLTNRPQIVHYHLEKKSDEQIQIEIKCSLFRKFRIFYYAFLFLLLIGSNIFLIFNSTYVSKSFSPITQIESHQSFSLAILISLLCFVSACFFYTRSISTFPYENFMNQFYDSLKKKGFSNRSDIHVGHSFPDMWKVLFLIGVFFLQIVFCFGIDNVIRENTFLSFFLYGAFLVIGLLIFLLILMNFQPTIKAKMFFALAGFSFCIPILLYFSPPAILSITGDLKELFNKYLNQGYPQKIIQYGSIFYLSSIVVIVLISFVSLINTLHLPIRIVMQLDKSATTNPASYFNRSFQARNSFFLFNILLVFLWGIFWVVKIVALYFTLTIVEISLYGSNYIFNSNIAIMFFENTKICFLFIFRPHIESYIILIFHRLTMLIYSAPMIALVLIIIRKNIKSGIDEYRLAKSSSNMDFSAEKQTSKTIKRICAFADIRAPIIRVIDSKDINAKAKYIGLPIFKNILIVSKGAFEELNDNEDEIEFLLAHEIGHIKKHTLSRRFLCFLSDYSLFGNGFLALLQNSYKIEREADYFAVEWNLYKHQDKNRTIGLLKSLLEKVEESTWKNAISQSNESLSFAQLKNNHCRTTFFKMFNDSSKLQKLKINIKLFIQMYFGDEIQSYIHPTNNQRIEWIDRKFYTDETN